MAHEADPRCPVCRASFRGTRACSRCGADLGPVMRLRAQSHLLREAARETVRRGDFRRALELARKAQALCVTEEGRKLELLLRWLESTKSARGGAAALHP